MLLAIFFLFMEKSYRIIAISIHASEKEATLSPLIHLCRYIISIHASEKEATPSCSGRRIAVSISIHASEKEATTVPMESVLCFRFQSTPPRRRRRQHIVIPQLSCTYLVSTTFLSAIFSFISQYVVLFFFF